MSEQRTWARVVLFTGDAVVRTELLRGTIEEGPDANGDALVVVSELRGRESVCLQVPIKAFSKKIRRELRQRGVDGLGGRNLFKIRREFAGGKLYIRAERSKQPSTITQQLTTTGISIPWLD